MDIRFIAASDAEKYQDILARTTEEDRYCRFFHFIDHFDLEEIERFTSPRADTIGFIAEEDGVALGVAHAFFMTPDRAEIAIVVARDVRRRGVGRALLERLIAALRECGCATAIACSLTANSAFATLARSVGMTVVGPPGAMREWTLAVPVTA